ncbi:endoplasmic reticulum mannosyl-oligosaccharide 1,2-alpha-mannosidase isoform X1 [Lates japonicus]|uniref:Endoplasmic reticulum mannosyl-oligosaccharide 1,2-alpha-mannosidase isoform X1 n=1 Tax=Lates japonicus TaxID=270547 RepID=A0AAD3RLP9_LATJO|nr:endoplasmic reticulum mannosyl-oligosaccharide 1,2-alpha-mannosidase isoform X1 [Lates japonicus]
MSQLFAGSSGVEGIEVWRRAIPRCYAEEPCGRVMILKDSLSRIAPSARKHGPSPVTSALLTTTGGAVASQLLIASMTVLRSRWWIRLVTHVTLDIFQGLKPCLAATRTTPEFSLLCERAVFTDMHPASRQGYVSISFVGQGSGNYNNSKQWRRQSCWRAADARHALRATAARREGHRLSARYDEQRRQSARPSEKSDANVIVTSRLVKAVRGREAASAAARPVRTAATPAGLLLALLLTQFPFMSNKLMDL